LNPARKYNIIVIGASAGGLNALSFILPALPRNYPIPIAVVQHRVRDQGELLEEVLQEKCRVKIKQADEKETLKSGLVYVAPPDYHLMIESAGTFSLASDEPVHYSRPSVDVLFETTAAVYQDRAIGILLTGANGDGAAGLAAIHKAGGLTIVQDPREALWPQMPAAGIGAGGAALILTLTDIRELLLKIGK
jgi:two-component system chemotaxis response regulator CheB